VALPTLAAAHHAVAWLPPSTGSLHSGQLISPARWAHSSKPTTAVGDGCTMGQTDRQAPDG